MERTPAWWGRGSTVITTGRQDDNDQDSANSVSGVDNHALPLGSESMPDWVGKVLTPKQLKTGNPVWLWKRLVYAADLPGIVKFLAITLADYCREDQLLCWPSLDELARVMGFKRRALIDATKKLEKSGLLIVERTKNPKTKRQHANVYRPAWPMFPISTTRVQEMHPGGAGDAPGLVQEMHPEPGAGDALEVSISKAPTKGPISKAAAGRPETSKERCIRIFAPLGISEDDCIRVVDLLRTELDDSLIQTALGQCENASDRIDSLGYLVSVARDFYRQRTGVSS